MNELRGWQILLAPGLTGLAALVTWVKKRGKITTKSELTVEALLRLWDKHPAPVDVPEKEMWKR